MASSESFVTFEQPWTFQRSLVSDFYTKENDALTKALQMSFTGGVAAADSALSLSVKPETVPFQTPTASGGSESEAPVSKPRSVGLTRKITKRKSRAMKGATTTFITADAANFRQMVQQVTGVRFGGLNVQVPVTQVLKPEPQRLVNRLQTSGGLPTLDTSSFLLGQTHHQQVDPASYLVAQPPVVSSQPPTTVVTDGGFGGLDFNSLSNFPTLESWKVM
ncbi:calmodulin-binding protein 25-like [Olea europaea var. sylvestris]|uniref:calmodulin-binding protein 25-like n=1 Tax=Olea europaea var. sylvestris TaxID=158386 RepID=UPI000C1D1B0A|nr:calmodulin-binding protein 25-like [Olea europaea var. sylvestris]